MHRERSTPPDDRERFGLQPGLVVDNGTRRRAPSRWLTFGWLVPSLKLACVAVPWTKTQRNKYRGCDRVRLEDGGGESSSEVMAAAGASSRLGSETLRVP